MDFYQGYENWLDRLNRGALAPIGALRCDGLQLAAGDVVKVGWQKYTIVDICAPLFDMRKGTQRRALVLVNGQGKPTPYTFGSFSLKLFEVVGGPKNAAASADRECVEWVAPGYWRWMG